jgi:hypothetical protein
VSSTRKDDNGELRDEALHRALLNAPDHTSAPNWRLRKAILDRAHDAVMPFSASPEPETTERPWWQRLLGLGAQGGNARMPWNAAVATVLVGVLVTVLWQREPVPGARPDSEAPVGAPAQRSAAPAAPASPSPAAPAPATVPPPPPPLPTPPQAAERALPSSQDIAGGPPPVPDSPAESATTAAPAKGIGASRPADRPAPAPARSELARRQADEAALSASPAASDKEASKRSERTRGEEESASRQRFASPAAPATGAGSARDSAEPAREGRAAAPPAAAPPAASASPALPTFSALSQWSRITITQRGGASRTLSRSEAQDLNALLGSAAISAIGTQPLAGTPEWRVTLERSNGDVMATFELGRNQVRWREGRVPPATGAPSASSLAALREALQHAVEPPAQPSSPSQWQFKPQPPPPAQPEAPPAAPAR